jgi:hypothetical protein
MWKTFWEENSQEERPHSFIESLNFCSAHIFPSVFTAIKIAACIPVTWKEGLFVNIPKKGDLSNGNNWRGVTLLSTPSKILTRIILNRIQNTVERHIRKEQAGFRKHRS